MIEQEKPTKKSPLKESPRRLPGQSVDEMINAKWDDLNTCLFVTVTFVAVAAMHWIYLFTKTPNQPVFDSIAAAIAILWCIWKYRKYRREAKLLRQGRDGERIVAELLEPTKAKGYRVLHDLVGGNFNLDHVLVGPSGVFAIETKTWSKSTKQTDKIQFDGSGIAVNGFRITPNPVDQAKANAAWLRETLHRSTGRSFKVIPVVVFPGWFVELKARAADLFVLNPKGLDPVLTALPQTLSPEEIAMVTFHLEQFVRIKEPKV